MLFRTFILAFTILAATGLQAQDQSLIGMGKMEVEDVVKKHYRDFSRDQSIVKQEFNYLKYVNGSGTMTWIIYFNDDDICTSTKKVCDYTEYDFVLDELNENYESVGDMQWEYSIDKQTYSVTLEEKDWYFSVRERVKKNKK